MCKQSTEHPDRNGAPRFLNPRQPSTDLNEKHPNAAPLSPDHLIFRLVRERSPYPKERKDPYPKERSPYPKERSPYQREMSLYFESLDTAFPAPCKK
eukprot:sb/3479106/